MLRGKANCMTWVLTQKIMQNLISIESVQCNNLAGCRETGSQSPAQGFGPRGWPGNLLTGNTQCELQIQPWTGNTHGKYTVCTGNTCVNWKYIVWTTQTLKWMYSVNFTDPWQRWAVTLARVSMTGIPPVFYVLIPVSISRPWSQKSWFQSWYQDSRF